jgi:hypothetical protein
MARADIRHSRADGGAALPHIRIGFGLATHAGFFVGLATGVEVLLGAAAFACAFATRSYRRQVAQERIRNIFAVMDKARRLGRVLG